MIPQAAPWWMPDIHVDRRPLLQARRSVLTALRAFLEGRGFVEVETAILQRSPGNEAHLHAFATELIAPDGTAQRRYLHTSPEFACKKLLAAGEPRIFEFARYSGIASAERCIIRNSPCWNGTARASPTRP